VLQVNQLNALAGLTQNQMQNALALDADYGQASGDLFQIIDDIDIMPDADKKKDALNDLSGHFYANVMTLAALNTAKNNVFSRLNKSYFSTDDELTKRTFWVSHFAGDNSYKGDINSPEDFSSDWQGFQAGFDTMKKERQVFGIAASYGSTNANQKNDKAEVKGYNITGYGAYFFSNNFETLFMVAAGKQDYKTQRRINYLDRRANAEFDGYSLNLSAQAAYSVKFKNDFCFKPFAGLDYSYVNTQSFTETGADSANLKIYDGSYNRTDALIGLRLDNGHKKRLKVYAEIKMDLMLAGRYGEFEAEYQNTAHNLKIKGIENDFFNMVYSAGMVFDIFSGFGVFANVNSFTSGTQNGLWWNAGLNYKFSTTVESFYEKYNTKGKRIEQ
jgi:outer membrane autotransporter protein